VGQVQYDIRGWPQERLEDVLGTLARSNIAFEVEDGKLLVDESRKLTVGAIVASIVVDGDEPVAATDPVLPPPPPPGFGTIGAPPPLNAGPPGTVVKAKVSSYAVASLVLGLVWICGVGSLLAVVFGIMGIRQVNRSEGRITGKGLAVAGLVLGILGVALIVWGMVASDTTTTGPR